MGALNRCDRFVVTLYIIQEYVVFTMRTKHLEKVFVLPTSKSPSIIVPDIDSIPDIHSRLQNILFV